MSWICEYCSTANDSHNTICFVCDHERSRESIRAQKREEREEKLRHVIPLIYSRVISVGRIAAFSAIGVFCLAALIILIARISEGSLGDTVYAFRAIDSKVQSVLTRTASYSFDAISAKFMGYPPAAVGESLEAIFTHALFSAGDSIDGVIIEVFVNKSMKFEAFSAAIREILNLHHTRCDALISSLEALMLIQADRGETLFGTARQLWAIQVTKREVLLGTVKELWDVCALRSERLIDTLSELVGGISSGIKILTQRLTYALGRIFEGIGTLIDVISRLIICVGERIKSLIGNTVEIIDRVKEPFTKLKR